VTFSPDQSVGRSCLHLDPRGSELAGERISLRSLPTSGPRRIERRGPLRVTERSAVTSVIAQEAGGDINACVNRGGSIRIIASGETCKTEPASQAETPLSWPSESAPTVSFVAGTPSPIVDVGPSEESAFQSTCPEGSIAIGRDLTYRERTFEVQYDGQQTDHPNVWEVRFLHLLDDRPTTFGPGFLDAICVVSTP
jgi:hypothetical protein